MSELTLTFTAGPEHIDQLGHVNNTVWVQWIQDIAIAHWESRARTEHLENYYWVVIRHEIDYRGNVGEGESVTARTFVPNPPRGPRFDRHVEFRDAGGKVLVSAISTWVMMDRATNRLMRIPADVVALFFDA